MTPEIDKIPVWDGTEYPTHPSHWPLHGPWAPSQEQSKDCGRNHYKSSILQKSKILVSLSIEHMDKAFIRTRSHQRIIRMEHRLQRPPEILHKTYLTHSTLVITQSLIRLRREIHIKPADTTVVATHQSVVSSRMNGDSRNVLAGGTQLLNKRLLLQVINTNLRLAGQSSNQRHTWVQTNRKGLLGWNANNCTMPLHLLKGFWSEDFDS